MAVGAGGYGLKRPKRQMGAGKFPDKFAASATALLMVAGTAIAAQPPATDVAEKQQENLAALMEFVGGWERSNGEWVDAMSLDTTSLDMTSQDTTSQDAENDQQALKTDSSEQHYEHD